MWHKVNIRDRERHSVVNVKKKYIVNECRLLCLCQYIYFSWTDEMNENFTEQRVWIRFIFINKLDEFYTVFLLMKNENQPNK